jgi:hypothetical protein
MGGEEVSNLKKVLDKYLPVLERDVTAGGSKAVQELSDRLHGLVRKNNRYFWVCVALLVIVLLASLGLVILFRNQPAAIAGVFAALGATAYGGVWKMVQLWREKLATDVIIDLLREMTVPDAVDLLKKVFLPRLT